MVQATTDIRKVCTKNRAEELGFDVWQHFAVPLFYDRLAIGDTSKANRIVGGRGSGKTMLLRYLSHHSMFSPNREEIPHEALRHIGLYWKVDTHFANLLTERGVPEDVWSSAFEHFLALSLASDAVSCLKNVAESAYAAFSLDNFSDVILRTPRDFVDSFSLPLRDLAADLQRHIRCFQTWANNPRTTSPPVFLPGRSFLAALVTEICETIPAFSHSSFFAYIDEYENLREYQQEIMNTYLKHSEPPLIFNIATKRNGMTTVRTTGSESITNIADYRTHDLDSYLSDAQFELFAAEILFLRFATMAKAVNVPIEVKILRDPSKLSLRMEPSYRAKVIGAARRIFPGLTESEMASHAISTPTMKRQLTTAIATALKSKNSDIDPLLFVDDSVAQATFIVPALLHRRALTPRDVLAEFQSLQRGEINKFTGKTNWIHNNFVGCFLQAYVPFGRTCPFYAGFNAFVSLSRANLRHFLEICHNSLKHVGNVSSLEDLIVPVDEQAESAREASVEFLREIHSFGKLGNRLHAFVLSLGHLLALAHRRPSQSEPEISHFSVIGGVGRLTDDDSLFFSEAVKWSVLFEDRETKIKNDSVLAGTEWMLAPIYAPYFNITFRKKRRIDLSIDDVQVLIRGDAEQKKELVARFEKKWSVTDQSGDSGLFAKLTEEQA
jgi:hypothetical protein